MQVVVTAYWFMHVAVVPMYVVPCSFGHSSLALRPFHSCIRELENRPVTTPVYLQMITRRMGPVANGRAWEDRQR